MLYKRKEMWYIITMINKYYEDENLDTLLKEYDIEEHEEEVEIPTNDEIEDLEMFNQ
jgi:hypothetical protein